MCRKCIAFLEKVERVMWLLLLGMLVVIMLLGPAHADEPRARIEPLVTYVHLSDALTGAPLASNPPGCERTSDFFGAGVTVAWTRVELDLAHGVKRFDAWCRPHTSPLESGTLIALRWYPWRR